MSGANSVRRQILEFVKSLDWTAEEEVKPRPPPIVEGEVAVKSISEDVQRGSNSRELESIVLQEREEKREEVMAQDLNAALMDLLGLLSEAQHRVTTLLRGGSPVRLTSASLVQPPAAPEAEENGFEAPKSSALDRVQEYPKPGVDVVEVTPGKRGRRGKLPADFDQIGKGLYIDQDMSAKEIGEKFGVSHGTVAQRVMKLGLSKRGPSPAKGKKRK